MNETEKYIESHWDECIKECREDNGTLMGLPYPYTVPAVGRFDEIYYWDTYFTNVGLILAGRSLTAKCNVDDMLYLVDKHGFMPNGNRTYFLKNSQPPFLSEMVKDIYDVYGDNIWLRGAYETLKKEYNFWMTKRLSPVGLNFYSGTLADDEVVKIFADMYVKRTGSTDGKSEISRAKQSITCCESGWDMNPRWNGEGYNYAPVDLNSLMYLFEKNMAFFAEKLENDESSEWEAKAAERKQLMQKYMCDDKGVMLDYDFVNDKLSNVFSVASLYPLYAGLADKEYAELMDKELARLETNFGLVSCEKQDTDAVFQWGYPNGWACLQHIAVVGFDKYGFDETAQRLARKYVTLVEKVFAETGNLWEKYNMVEGNINVNQEDAGSMPPMMGWSAGVYLFAKSFAK